MACGYKTYVSPSKLIHSNYGMCIPVCILKLSKNVISGGEGGIYPYACMHTYIHMYSSGFYIHSEGPQDLIFRSCVEC